MVGHLALTRAIRLRPSPLAWIHLWTLLLIETGRYYVGTYIGAPPSAKSIAKVRRSQRWLLTDIPDKWQSSMGFLRAGHRPLSC